MSVENAGDNCGFTALSNGPLRVWLAGDDTETPGRDLWLVANRFYPLQLNAFDRQPPGSETEVEIEVREGRDLGGYTASMGLDEAPYDGLPPNVGFYCFGPQGGDVIVRRRGLPKGERITLDAGDFYAGDIEHLELPEVATQTYFMLVLA